MATFHETWTLLRRQSKLETGELPRASGKSCPNVYDVRPNIGLVVLARRLEKKMTVSEVASHSGVTKERILSIEKGTTIPFGLEVDSLQTVLNAKILPNM
jgi:DNA-binding XRE family transcriptional regulator